MSKAARETTAKKKRDQEKWQRMIDNSRKSQEKMQLEKEQQKMIQRKKRLEEKEQLEKEQRLIRQLKRRQVEEEQRAKKWQEIIEQRRKQQAEERRKRMQQRKDQQKREQQQREQREQSEKDQRYMMQLLIPLLEKFTKNTTSPELLSATVAAEMRTDVGLPPTKKREIQSIRKVENFEEGESTAAQKTQEYERRVSLLNNHCSFGKNALRERIFFRRMQQKGRETIAQYATRLKEQAQSCGFGTMIDEHVRDQIVGSCRSTEMIERFLDEGAKLTLEKLLEIGTLLENTDELNLREDADLDGKLRYKAQRDTSRDEDEDKD